MPDTLTASLGLLQQATGENGPIWGENLNTQVIQFIEDAIVGRTPIATTGGTTTLTQAQARSAFLDITGTLSSDATIVVPNTKNRWVISNGTSGGFAVLVKTAAGLATSIPQGTSKDVSCDGSNNVRRMDRDQVGEFFYHAGTIPAGSRQCDGSAISRSGIGLDLFAKIGTTWGAGNGTTTFNVPNGTDTGRYLRSRNGGVGQGTSQADQNKSHNHTASASTSTGVTTDPVGNHGHGVSDPTHAHGYSDPTHSHGYSDPTHSHSWGFQEMEDHGSTVTMGAGFINTRAVSTSLPSQGTLGNGVGISLHAASIGISISFAGTGISIQAAGGHAHTASGSSSTSVTVNADGGAEHRPTTLVGVLCVWL